MDENAAVAGVKPAAEVSAKQTSDGSWPRPGDEGYVTPDGTEHSRKQLEDNRRAAADRMAAGSTVHGAPMATPGPQVREQAAAAEKRAEAYSGPTEVDRRKGVTEFIRTKTEEAAKEVEAAEAKPEQRTADKPRPDSVQR